VIGAGTLNLRSSKYTNETTLSADYSVVPWPDAQMRWFRIMDDGVNRQCQYSGDGEIYRGFHAIGRTDFLTADQIGVHVFTTNAATPNFGPTVRVHSWYEH